MRGFGRYDDDGYNLFGKHDSCEGVKVPGDILNVSWQTCGHIEKLKHFVIALWFFSEQHQIRRKQVHQKTNSFMGESFENILNPKKLSTFVLSLFIEIVCIIISTEMNKKMIASYASWKD